MRISKGYQTRQRSLILNYLASNKDRHITADEIINYFRSQETKIGKSTVYRYLNLLLETGIIRKYLRDAGPTSCYRYIGTKEVESIICHLKCESCGKVLDVSCDEVKPVRASMESQHGFAVDLNHTVFYGCCQDCQIK